MVRNPLTYNGLIVMIIIITKKKKNSFIVISMDLRIEFNIVSGKMDYIIQDCLRINNL